MDKVQITPFITSARVSKTCRKSSSLILRRIVGPTAFADNVRGAWLMTAISPKAS
jgi:hypothetical protein